MKFFEKLSVTKKLILLSGFLLLNLAVGEMISRSNTKRLANTLRGATSVYFPAARNATLLDMMHDGIRASAYHALIVSTSKNASEREEVRKEFTEMATNITVYLDKLDKLPLDTDVVQALKESRPLVGTYVRDSEELVDAALAGNSREAFALVPKVQNSFEHLEETLGKLGDLIEEDAKEAEASGLAAAETAEARGLQLLAFGLIFGTLFSVWIVRSLLKTFANVITALASESSRVNQAALDVSAASKSLSESTVQQASALQETAASIEQISAMVKKTSESSKSLEGAAHQSHDSANRGRQSIQEMLESITTISESNDRIMQQVEDSNNKISDIAKVISEIGNKTKVINDIVFQTKLLSFNASVEAARAGEHGKGFAVVAEEVGNLAQMSGTAAKEIGDMLQSSISKVENIVSETKQKVEGLIVDGRGKVDRGMQVAKQCGGALDEIVKQVDSVNVMINEITTAIHEQTQGIHEISKAIGQLDQSTHVNSSTSTQAAGSARELLSQAQSLNSIVGTLKETVNGSGSGDTNISPQPAVPKEATAQEEVKNNVVSLKKNQVVAAQAPQQVAKRAVGHDAIPAENDPRFKDL